jgi:predicted transcriptional regulator
MSRRKNKEIRDLILKSFKAMPKSIHELAISANINWRTTELHLNYLKGRELVKEVFTHRKLRIFEITKQGKEFLERGNYEK